MTFKTGSQRKELREIEPPGALLHFNPPADQPNL
jgi:hypothetical protein